MDPTWQSSLGGERLAYIDEHMLQGAVILPGAAYVEMALAAAPSCTAGRPVRDLEFKHALLIPRRADTVVQLATTGSAGLPAE